MYRVRGWAAIDVSWVWEQVSYEKTSADVCLLLRDYAVYSSLVSCSLCQCCASVSASKLLSCIWQWLLSYMHMNTPGLLTSQLLTMLRVGL